MILDKQYLKINQTKNFTEYIYNYPSKDKKIEIILTAKSDNFQVKYIVGKWITGSDGKLVELKDNDFETTDLKAAWEKFEDYFEQTEKEENPQQGQEPEVQVLMMSVDKSGKSYLFLQKQDGSQELIMELNINDSEIINNKPQFAKLDFSNDTSMQEPFNTEWLLAFVDDVQYEQASKGCTTYIVALKSIDQPGQNEPSKQDGENKQGEQDDKQGEPSEPKDSDTKGDKGDKSDKDEDKQVKDEPTDDATDEPGDKGEPKDDDGDDDGEKTDKTDKGSEEKHGEQDDKKPDEISAKGTVNKQTVSNGVSKIAQETGLSSDDVQSSLRSERIFDSFLSINNVDVNKLKSALGVSDLTKNQFIREMVKNA